MYDFPIKYYEDNLIINKKTKDCWAVYKVIGFNYDFRSEERKIMQLNRLTRFIANIGAEAKILIIPVAQDVKLHYKGLMAKLPKVNPLYNYAKAHAEGTEAYLSANIDYDGRCNDSNVYVVVKLTKSKELRQILDDFIRRPMKVIEELFEVEYKELLFSELKTFAEAADTYFREQDKRLRLIKTGAETTQWLIKRMFRRGVRESVPLRKNRNGEIWMPGKEIVIKDGEKAIRPHEKDVLSLTESLIEPGKEHIKVASSDGKVSYQTFLTIAHIPDGLIFPGSEWLLLLQDHTVATEVCMHITAVEHKESIKKISGKKREIKSQIEHVAENDEVPDELFEAKENADSLEAELKAARDPLIRVSVSICIASEDKKEIQDNARIIKEWYEDHNFIVEKPITDQFKLFMEFIPGAGRFVNDYVLPLPPRTVAGSMFAATRIIGDSEGPFIGTTGTLKKMVFLWLAKACQLNRSASATFLGTLGGGKSFNANLLLYLTVLYGGKALIVDPKGERSKWKETLPELAEHMSISTLSAGEEDIGKLDPFLIYKNNLEEAGELALNIICEIYGFNSRDDEYDVIKEAIKNTRQHETPCMSVLSEALMNFPETDEYYTVARKLGRKIKNLREVGMAKLLFGTGKEKGLSFDKLLNIIQIQNLQMPGPETLKSDYSQEELISTVLMLPIASFAKTFAMSDRKIFKIVLFDESWALNSTQMGIKLFNFLARMGRSLNAGCIFIGHSVKDLKGEGIKSAITYKFCFKTTVGEEIERVLDFLDLEVTDDNIDTVKGLGNGECLFQDLDGRVGKLKFDAVYGHLLKAFDTTPQVQQEEANEAAS
ncbi:MAG: ATP-binding protein [Eubacteriales bacterium]|nr:ATP-binding protein [Eubacteriales bacterium]